MPDQPPWSSLALPLFRAQDYGIDRAGNDVNAGPWAALLAAIGGQAHPRGARISFPAGDIALTNAVLDTTTLSLNSAVIIEGQGADTRIFPGGGQGRALTLIGSGSPQLRVTVRDLKLGYGPELGAVDLPYTQPILELRHNARFSLSGLEGYLAGTGTLVYLNDTYDGSLEEINFDTNNYGVPLAWDLAANTADQADSVALRSCIFVGEWGAIFNGAINTLAFDDAKFVKHSATTLAESALAAVANVGDSTISMTAGDGALFAVGDPIAIDQPPSVTSTGPGTANGFGTEVNKVTDKAVDVLTLAWPLQYKHDTGTGHRQVLRGGIGIAIGGSIENHVHDSHLEGFDTGILATAGTGLQVDNTTHQCNRLLRITGNLSDVEIGALLAAGAPPGAVTSNIILDVPTWNASAPARIAIDGPLVGSTLAPTVNWKGTVFTLDAKGYYLVAPGTGFVQGPWNTFGVKLGSEGIRFKGLLTMAAIVAAGATVLQLPPPVIPRRSALLHVWQSNSQSTSAVPAPNTLWVQGSDQGASSGLVTMRIASTAAGWLSLDSLPLLTAH